MGRTGIEPALRVIKSHLQYQRLLPTLNTYFDTKVTETQYVAYNSLVGNPEAPRKLQIVLLTSTVIHVTWS